MPIHVRVGNIDIVVNRFTQLIRRIEAPKDALEEIRKDFFKIEQEQFDTEGSRSGQTWAPLRPSTVRRKPAGLGILVRRGKLRDSLTRAGAQYGYNRINRATLTVGTTHPAAEFHEAGAPAANLPRRSIIGVIETDLDRWAEIAGKYVVDVS